MKLLHFILSNSIFIAICAVALSFQTALLLQINLSIYLYLFIFFSTLCSYNFYWLLSGYAFGGQSVSFIIKKLKINFIIFFISAIATVFCVPLIAKILPVIFVGVLLTVLYTIPLLPFKIFYNTRKAGLVKTFLLAFTWAFVTVYIPYQQAVNYNGLLVLMLFNNRFLFMLMLCIIFDARDTGVDKIRGMQSLATIIKPVTIKYIMYAIFAAYVINGILFRIYFNEISQIIPLLITGSVTAVVYFFSLKKQDYFFYYFVVDGLMLFSAVVSYMATICLFCHNK